LPADGGSGGRRFPSLRVPSAGWSRVTRLEEPGAKQGDSFMKLPLQIVFRNLDPSSTVEEKIRERSEKLEKYAEDIMSCRVTVEANHRHHNGNFYHVVIDLKMPHAELVASREAGNDHAHEDLYVAVRDAFDALKRQVEAYVRRRRGDVKLHENARKRRAVKAPEPGA
jgi:ribosomal subunit interface protein